MTINYSPASVHYHRRRSDDMYEVVARAQVDGIWREVALDVQPNRVMALKRVRHLRGYAKPFQPEANTKL